MFRVRYAIWGVAWASALAATNLGTYAQDGRGIGTVVLRDEQGQERALYSGSYALVIGVSDYSAGWPDLRGVRKDVEAVKQELERNGFTVEPVMDPSSAQLKAAFESFINRYGLEKEHRLLFYYAGHGHTETQGYGGEMGYIVPADAPLPAKDRNGFLRLALSMQQIEVYARQIQSKHALFLFDSCFSGSIFALGRAVPESISYKAAQPVRQFITSGSAEEEVPDVSLFCQQFVAI